MMHSLKNNQGIAMLQALMVTAIVGAVSGIILSQTRLTDKTLMVPRIRSEMLIAESAFRNFAYMNATYTNADAVAGLGAVAIVNNEWLDRFESNLNYLCPPPATCRVEFAPAAPLVPGDNFQYDAATHTLSTRIVYTGPNVQIRPIDISIVVPEHILTGAPFRCAARVGGTGTPFFRGYAGAQPNCTGWPGNQVTDGGQCPAGQFMRSFSNTTMALDCVPFSSASPACAANEYISNVTWPAVAGGTISFTCAPRPNAFTYFPGHPAAVANP